MAKKAKETFIPFNVSDHLKDEKAMARYLAACMEESDDPAYIAAALGNIAKAYGMVRLAKDAGLAREALYRALSKDGNPHFGTVLKVTKALGLKLTAKAA